MTETHPDPAPLALPMLGELVAEMPHWHYPSRDCAGGEGWCRLRVWKVMGGHLAVVTELGDANRNDQHPGVSVTNAIADIWERLTRAFGGRLLLLEHWPAATGAAAEEHLDAVLLTGRRPDWTRVWPTSPGEPQHEMLEAWMALHGAEILTPDAAFTCCTTPMPWPTDENDRICPQCLAVWEITRSGTTARIKTDPS